MPPLLRAQTFRARAQRRASTPAETALWNLLRGRRIAGAKFRRHQPLGPFIVDFVCFDARLVVEVDGGYHLRSDVARCDLARDQMLRAARFGVLRLSNDVVLHHPEVAVLRIRARLGNDALTRDELTAMPPTPGRTSAQGH